MAKKTKTKQTRKGVAHHAKRLYHWTPRFVHGMVIGAFIGMVLVMSFGPVLPTHALSLNSVRDCDSNAVIRCGALSTKELKKAYERWPSVGHIYNGYFGISTSDIKNIDKYVVAGRVYKNGEVRIGKKLDKVVATNAVTAGRENVRGSKAHIYKGTKFYTRPPKTSFRVNSIAAYVVMKNGKYDFAILAACGNPVKATAKSVPKPVPPPEEPEPEDIPQRIGVPPSTQTPVSTPTPLITASEESKPLPVTGPGDVGLVVLLAVLGGYLYHVTHRHIRRRRAHRQHSA